MEISFLFISFSTDLIVSTSDPEIDNEDPDDEVEPGDNHDNTFDMRASFLLLSTIWPKQRACRCGRKLWMILRSWILMIGLVIYRPLSWINHAVDRVFRFFSDLCYQGLGSLICVLLQKRYILRAPFWSECCCRAWAWISPVTWYMISMYKVTANIKTI